MSNHLMIYCNLSRYLLYKMAYIYCCNQNNNYKTLSFNSFFISLRILLEGFFLNFLVQIKNLVLYKILHFEIFNK